MPPVYPADLYASSFFPAVCQSIKPDDLFTRRIFLASCYTSLQVGRSVLLLGTDRVDLRE